MLGYFTFYPDLSELFFFGIVLLHFGLIAANVILIGFGLWLFRKHRGLASVAVVSGVILLFAFYTFGFGLGENLRFALLRSHYEKRLAVVLEARKEGRAITGNDFQTDKGPPVRIAFYWMRGVTDNWAGLVHDPTRMLKDFDDRPDRSREDDSRTADVVRDWFGGTLYRARHMSGDWYLCWFT